MKLLHRLWIELAERKHVQVTLQPDGVSGPAQRVVAFVTEAVGTSLRALDADDCEHDDAWEGGAIGYRFAGLELSASERRDAFKNWVLAKGFQDLARGIRETLEEALLFIRVQAKESGVLTTWGEFQAEVAAIKAEASKLTFPPLMERVNAGLREAMAFDAEFQTLQKVRNCLEHRGGRVGQKDVDPATGTLVLSFPRLRMFYLRGNEEVELEVGKAIDRQADDAFADEGVRVFIGRVTRTREYQLDEPVVITRSDFFEIAMACHLFAGDVASKLPGVPPLAAEVEPKPAARRSP